MKNVNLRGEFF